jgi:hypothetical protein
MWRAANHRLTLDVPALSAPELALRFTTRKAHFVSEAAVPAESYHRIKALPQVIPAPIAIIAIRSPG